MAVNLAEKYSKQIAEKFHLESLVQGNVSTEYEWAGVKTVNVYTPVTVELNDYDRTASANRFGTPQEMQDSVQALTLTRDKSFSLAVDRGNNEDQNGIKAGARMLRMEIKEQAVPLMDKWALGKFVNAAGIRAVIAEVPTKSTIAEMLFDGATAMDNELVPADNRICYIRSSVYNMLRLSPEFQGPDKLAEKALSKGMVGMAADMRVIKVPDKYLPDAYFLCTHKAAVLAPVKIKTARILTEAPGIDGVLLEGRYYFDAFVLGAKAGGVYAAVPSASVVAEPALALSGGNAEVTAVDGVTFYYTTDGTDPRYSKSAMPYASAVAVTAGDVINVAGQNAAGAWSAVTTQKAE